MLGTSMGPTGGQGLTGITTGISSGAGNIGVPASGQYLTNNTFTGTPTWANTASMNAKSISSGDKSIDFEELHAIMETVKKRLLILIPNFEKHEKYQMLKDAYDEYRAIEALLSDPRDLK